MKVILSRKGFDGSNGGMPSLIMPNGDMISMPIPSPGDADSYSDLIYDGKSYYKILRELKRSFIKRKCHLDPDIYESRRRIQVKGWKPAFGQIGASSSYLLNTVQISPGDIILFFGNFHSVEECNNQYRFVRRTGDFYRDNDLQVIWGYLQVQEILRDPSRILKEYPWHPHAKKVRLKDQSNMLIVPRKNLSFAPTHPGFGVLPFSYDRVLTKYGAKKATWKYNSVYAPSSIIGKRKNSAGRLGVYYSGIWQELGLKQSVAASKWARKMVLAPATVLGE